MGIFTCHVSGIKRVNYTNYDVTMVKTQTCVCIKATKQMFTCVICVHACVCLCACVVGACAWVGGCKKLNNIRMYHLWSSLTNEGLYVCVCVSI